MTTTSRARLRAIAAVVAAVAGVCSSAAVCGSAAAAQASSSARVQARLRPPATALRPPATALRPPTAALHPPATTRKASLHWVGYTFPVRDVTGVRADWTEPTVTGKAGSEEFVWLGVGGWNQADNNIVQAGTFAYFPRGGGRNEGVWYERVPTDAGALFPLVPVGPGDHIGASITRLAGPGSNWRISVTDTTTGASFAKTVQFKSLESYPSFVVEDPDKGKPSPDGPFYPFPRWKSVTFAHIAIRLGKTWTSAARLSRYRVDMVRRGRTLAVAGALSTRSSFTASQR